MRLCTLIFRVLRTGQPPEDACLYHTSFSPAVIASGTDAQQSRLLATCLAGTVAQPTTSPDTLFTCLTLLHRHIATSPACNQVTLFCQTTSFDSARFDSARERSEGHNPMSCTWLQALLMPLPVHVVLACVPAPPPVHPLGASHTPHPSPCSMPCMAPCTSRASPPCRGTQPSMDRRPIGTAAWRLGLGWATAWRICSYPVVAWL